MNERQEVIAGPLVALDGNPSWIGPWWRIWIRLRNHLRLSTALVSISLWTWWSKGILQTASSRGGGILYLFTFPFPSSL